MDLGIAGKVALVTASSKGLGKASALALAREGAKVVITARGEEALSKAREEIEAEAGEGEVLAIRADITDPDAPARVVRDTLDRFGGLNILVANAGGPPPGRALDVTDEQIADAVNANLTTSVRLVREALPALRSGGAGRICCITSYSVKQPVPNLALSNLARTGLWAWAKTAARDLFPDVTLNLVCPGPHATDRMIQLGGSDSPMGDPGDFGRIVAFLCSTSASYISGTAVMVDGAASAGLL
ncbi:MAG TPA: SDR family oxidoreductase [Acidimicrobiales bacterium]|nr:SDR family oxidoreductase [Acidimicrobiales bacterium]